MGSSQWLKMAVPDIQAKEVTTITHGDDITVVTSNKRPNQQASDKYQCPPMKCKPRRMISFKHDPPDGKPKDTEDIEMSELEIQEGLEVESNEFKQWMFDRRTNGKAMAVIRRIYAPNLSP